VCATTSYAGIDLQILVVARLRLTFQSCMTEFSVPFFILYGIMPLKASLGLGNSSNGYNWVSINDTL
jgi:hypothetical protein